MVSKLYKYLLDLDVCKYVKEAKLLENQVKLASLSSNDPIEELYKRAFKESEREKWEKMWKSLTEGAVHKITKCMEKMKGKVDNPGAYCKALADFVGYTPERKKKSSIIYDVQMFPRNLYSYLKFGGNIPSINYEGGSEGEFSYSFDELLNIVKSASNDIGLNLDYIETEVLSSDNEEESIAKLAFFLSAIFKVHSLNLYDSLKQIKRADFSLAKDIVYGYEKYKYASASFSRIVMMSKYRDEILKEYINDKVNVDLSLNDEESQEIAKFVLGTRVGRDFLRNGLDKFSALYMYAQTVTPTGTTNITGQPADNQTQNVAIEDKPEYKKCMEQASGVFDQEYAKEMCKEITQSMSNPNV